MAEVIGVKFYLHQERGDLRHQDYDLNQKGRRKTVTPAGAYPKVEKLPQG